MERHGFDIEMAGWFWLALGVLGLLGIVLMGGRLGAHAGPLLLASRAATALTLGSALALPLSAFPSLALLGLAVFMACVADVGTTLVLTVLSPAGRATTLTFNSAANCIGTALGSALGGLALALGSYEAVGLCSLAWLIEATGLVRWSQLREAPAPVAATPQAARSPARRFPRALHARRPLRSLARRRRLGARTSRGRPLVYFEAGWAGWPPRFLVAVKGGAE